MKLLLSSWLCSLSKMWTHVSGRNFFLLYFVWLVLNYYSVCSAAKSHSIEVDESTASKVFNGEWMLMFYAPWCPACQSLKPIWQSFANQWSEDLSISVGLVDINKNPGLSGQFLVFQLPTLFHVKDGVVRSYTGARSKDAFVNWINDKSWRHTEPVAWWKNPNTIQMKAVAYFFRFANFIKDIHEQLTEEHQIPTILVYGLFAFVTILTGLLLGMILVVICDCIYPPKPLPSTDQRQYSKVEITKTPIKGQKKSKKDKAKGAAADAEMRATNAANNANNAADDATIDTTETEPSEEADHSGTVRKRKTRKE